MFSNYLSNMNIGRRLFILIATMTSILALSGILMVFGLGSASITTEKLNSDIERSVNLSQIYNTMNQDFIEPINNLSRGTLTWIDTNDLIRKNILSFDKQWKSFLSTLSETDRKETVSLYQSNISDFRLAIDEILRLGESQNSAKLSLFMLNDFDLLVTPLGTALQTSIHKQQAVADASYHEFRTFQLVFITLSIVFVIIGIITSVLLGISIRQSITNPVTKIADTVKSIANGDYDARTGLEGNDELSTLSSALDNLLEDKVRTLVETEKENDILNNSIIRLLEATSQLSDKDLTVTVPVSEDITGPVADAMNLVSSETAKVLGEIHHIAENVEKNASNVKFQGDKVTLVAEEERSMVKTTIERLENASKTMNAIAKLCMNCNEMAENASESTDEAFDAVTSTASGMDEIRGTISETEKRIKRLGERSQEISGIVDLINNIAERTHILALNASMHAAAAGEAGRGFAVVADEVQRLAESSRNATSQIAALVSNIQNETSETMETMNQTISQVVEGSDRAEQAGNRMRETQKKTSDLASAVAKIAERSINQAKINERLKSEAHSIQEKTQETDTELQQQSDDTLRLVALSNSLLKSVNTFTLPSSVLPEHNDKKAS